MDASAMTDAPVTARDASKERIPSNMSADGPFYNADTHTCVGCNDTGGAGGKAGSGGGVGGSSSGSGGAKGGSSGTNTTGQGGSSGHGGAVGSGGNKVDGGGGPDAHSPPDAAAADAMPSADAGQARDAIVDLRSDAGPDTVGTSCSARIDSIAPTVLGNLIAGPNAKVVLRASIASGGPDAPIWDWQGRFGTTQLVAERGQDSATAGFPIATLGAYTFTAQAGTCYASMTLWARDPDECSRCKDWFWVRAAAPASERIPVRSGFIPLKVEGTQTFSNVVLDPGMEVTITPALGTAVVRSYVRVNSAAGDLIVDGMVEVKQLGFKTRLLQALDGILAYYDVLVVPVNGTGDGTFGATAPQLFRSLGASDIGRTAAFNLSGGVAVTGTVAGTGSQPIEDARIILTNQDPSQPEPADLLFSSVGQTDKQGGFTLSAQPGQYWLTVSPRPETGLAEAVSQGPVSLDRPSTVTFQWDPPSPATLSLSVVDAVGAPQANARVVVVSAQAKRVGTLTFAPVGGYASTQNANGNVRREGATDDSGVVTFAGLPGNEPYLVVVSPANLGIYAATTSASVFLPAPGAAQTIRLSAEGTIRGQLLPPPTASTTPDWTQVQVVAYDKSPDLAEMPRISSVDKNGLFAVGVTPGRPYVLLAVPYPGSGLARTFVGSGPLMASELTLVQSLSSSIDWVASVMTTEQNPLAQTALQAFCGHDWPGCADSTIPLAETSSDANGLFRLTVPAAD